MDVTVLVALVDFDGDTDAPGSRDGSTDVETVFDGDDVAEGLIDREAVVLRVGVVVGVAAFTGADRTSSRPPAITMASEPELDVGSDGEDTVKPT